MERKDLISSVNLNARMWREIFERYRSDGRNLQDQIRTMLVDAILEGRLTGGSEVPSSRELSEAIGVARNTVVFSYQQLVEAGYLLTRDRSGHRVNPDMSRRTDNFSEPGTTRQDDASVKVSQVVDWEARLQRSTSTQRNIVKLSDWQRVPYPFLYGQFDASLFPTGEWRECCMKALSVADIREWAQDLIVRDDEALVREICAKVLPRRGVWASPEEVVVTVGAQHALYMIAELLFADQTRVAIENPGYPDARNIFSLKSQRIISVDVDQFGLPITAALEHCDYAYVTPSHQCPTTIKMPEERRLALLQSAEQHDFIVIEDDYEAESSFAENPSPALKSSDRTGRVLYIGSLSKTFAPGLRLGYIVGSPKIIRELRGLRRLMVRHPSAFIQRAFALFISLGHLDAMVRKQTLVYRERSAVLQETLSRHLPQFHVYPSHGGSSLWVRGPDGLDCRQLASQAESLGVLIECGDVFFNEPAPLEFFRLGFSAIRIDKIDAGIQQLAKAWNSL